MKKFALVGLLALAACSDPNGAREAAEAYGLRDVQIGGYAWIGCARDDDQHTKFTATNANGQRVEGVVCGNWSPFGKYSTVRIRRVIDAPVATPQVPL